MNTSVRILGLLSIVTSLSAHDFYILPGLFKVMPGSTIQVAFHNGDSFPDSEGPPSLARLKDPQLRFGGGTMAVQSVKVAGKRAVGFVQAPQSRGNLLLTASTSPNFITMTADKFLDYLKEEGLTTIIDWRSQHGESKKPSLERYSKFAKSLLVAGAPDDFYKTSVGFTIEIIPEANPYTLHPGTELPVSVVFRGTPAAGLQLEAAWSDNGKNTTTVIGRTDAEGRIRVPLTLAGKWRLHSLMMERCADQTAAEWESFWASLTFEVR